MLTRWLVATIHLLALGIGLGAIWGRGRALAGEIDAAALRRALYADALWGIAALLWIGTGLWRLLGGLEKGIIYYMQNHAFHAKMGLFLLILALEVWPRVILIRWRTLGRKGEPIDTTPALAIARISALQALLIIAMVFAAAAMARGLGS